ncbi:MAG: histidinol-phosphate transaminase [Bacteroidota bacterium]|nr:histidinol-phosphate transaminase [Bacteroidota bacterium]MDP4232199.1 histidinol-phosphate transaminase [Bacteroidota bacterium]MDP4243620.1 histidinol-phosphate transaminase [Bacteroidota bacterium]MDP4288726.1 histidinol-phosphate transaminase [Bacteroidota bacterium]
MKISLPQHIASLRPYKPGKPIADVIAEYGLTDVIKLASNENPLGPSPKAMEAVRLAVAGIHQYPNGGKSLREAIAAKVGLSVDQLIAGSGSEGVMTTFMRTFFSAGDEAVTSEGSFGGFYVLASAIGMKLVRTPMRNYGYDLDALADAITPKTRLIYIANPNNPTGTIVGRAEFESFYEKVPPNVIILHDEAYYDFAAGDTPDYYSLLTDIRANVVTLRTFSKSHGLAGIRIGFGSGPRELIEPMLKVKLPFEPGTLAQAAGIAALDDDEFLARTIATNRAGKVYLAKAFEEMGIAYIETAANFFCLPLGTEEDAKRLTDELERRGVITRWLGGFGLPDCVRISIGTQQENERAVAAMKEVLHAQVGVNGINPLASTMTETG